MWELDHKEGWELKNGCFELWCWRRLLRVPWTARRSNPSILKEISPEQSLERLMLKLRLPILWPHDVKNWLVGKDPDAGKDWRQEKKGMTEDEMVGWHHQLNGITKHGFGWTPGVGDGQGGLMCCGLWSCKESDTTEWLNWTELMNPRGWKIRVSHTYWAIMLIWLFSLLLSIPFLLSFFLTNEPFQNFCLPTDLYPHWVACVEN